MLAADVPQLQVQAAYILKLQLATKITAAISFICLTAFGIIAACHSPFFATTNGMVTAAPLSLTFLFFVIGSVIVRRKLVTIKDRDGRERHLNISEMSHNGGMNRVKLAIDLLTGQLFVQYNCKKIDEAQRNFMIEHLLNDEPHFIKPGFALLASEKTYLWYNDYYPHTFENVRDKDIPFKTKMRMAEQLLKALVSLEKIGVFHKDLSPDNVFYDDNFQIAVADFNISVFYADENAEKDVFKLRWNGKEKWFPPEYVFFNHIDRRSPDKEEGDIINQWRDLLIKINAKIDIWNVGYLLANLFNMTIHRENFDNADVIFKKFTKKQVLTELSSLEKFLNNYFRGQTSLVEEPANKTGIEYLIYRMVQLDYTKRPTPSQLLEIFKTLQSI